MEDVLIVLIFKSVFKEVRNKFDSPIAITQDLPKQHTQEVSTTLPL